MLTGLVHRFEFVRGGSSKFWEISYLGSVVIVRFGRIGTNGQTQTKDLGSETAAAFHAARLIKEKLAKGYVAVGVEGGEAPSLPEPLAVKPGITRPPRLPPYEMPALPEDGPLSIDRIQLPSGRRVSGTPSMAPPGIRPIEAPVMWLTASPVDEAAAVLYRLRPLCRTKGLTPILAATLEADDARPWDSQEFCPTDPRRPDSFSAEQVLADWWQESFDAKDEDSLAPLAPFGTDFPGLAPPPAGKVPSGFARLFSPPVDRNDDRSLLKTLRSRRIGLVAAPRPADVITALGWLGAVNIHDDPALMSAVLRSWEDRWAARVVEVGFDTLTLTVGSPPRDRQTALRLAAEHFAFCPDGVWQGSDTIAAYAELLPGNRIWHFWWD